jgi:hypothetical protein
MTRLEKCELLKSKGYTYDPETGKIYGIRGKEIIRKCNKGYILLSNHLKGHHFAWYITYGNVNFDILDHINRDKSDNRICNLRILTNQQNLFNTNKKGYSWHNVANKWISQIGINNKSIYLGLFNTEEEARNAYLQAKEKYHII